MAGTAVREHVNAVLGSLVGCPARRVFGHSASQVVARSTQIIRKGH